MMPWVTPVTDRTEEDILARTPKVQWLAENLNRLEGNCVVLAELLGVRVTTRAWERTDFPTVTQLSRIRGNIDALRQAYRTYATTPQTPDDPLNTWQKWNDAERILADLYDLYNKTLAAILRLGEGYAGDEIGVI